MTYTQIAFLAAALVIVIDLFLFKTRLLSKKTFWSAYAIIVSFQLLTNWWLTSRNIVMYNEDTIIGTRIACAPVEDLLFGFALVTGVLINWVRLGRLQK